MSFQQGASITGLVVLKVRFLSVCWHFISLHNEDRLALKMALYSVENKTIAVVRNQAEQTPQTFWYETHAVMFFPTSWSTTRFIWIDWNILKALNPEKGNRNKNKPVEFYLFIYLYISILEGQFHACLSLLVGNVPYLSRFWSRLPDIRWREEE